MTHVTDAEMTRGQAFAADEVRKLDSGPIRYKKHGMWAFGALLRESWRCRHIIYPYHSGLILIQISPYQCVVVTICHKFFF